MMLTFLSQRSCVVGLVVVQGVPSYAVGLVGAWGAQS